MMTCDTARGRLEELFDGELHGDDAASVQAHVHACAACAAEIAAFKRLEDVLRGAPAGARPDGERYLARVKERTRARENSRWTALLPLAAAAMLMIGLAWVLASPTPSKGTDISALVDEYRTADAERQAAIEKKLQAGGADAIVQLKALVQSGLPQRQQAAAVILARYQDKSVTQWLVDYSNREPASPDVLLLEIGSEPSDDELVGSAFDLLRSSKTREDGFSVLRKLHKGGLNRQAAYAMVDRVKGLLASPSPKDQELGLEVLRTVGVKFPLPDLVDLLDVPELGDKAYEFLKQQTNKDYGRDKKAWAEYFGRRL